MDLSPFRIGPVATTETRIWLLRHAETTVPGVLHGAESDVHLSERGKRQAEAMAEWFADKQLTAVVSSNMTRAITTAAPIVAKANVPHSVEHDLYERRIGALSGTPFTLSEGPWVDTLIHWTAGNTHYTTPGAESFAELQLRLLPAFARVAQAHAGGRVAVVAHGIVCKVLLLTLLQEYGPEGWHRLGKIENMSTSLLVAKQGQPWQAESILEVPDVVRTINETHRGPRSVA